MIISIVVPQTNNALGQSINAFFKLSLASLHSFPMSQSHDLFVNGTFDKQLWQSVSIVLLTGKSQNENSCKGLQYILHCQMKCEQLYHL